MNIDHFKKFIRKNNIGAVLILVAFGIVAFCGVAAVVIDLSRVYLESARIEESVEASAVAASRELAHYKTTLDSTLSGTQETAIRDAAIAYAAKNGLTITADQVIIAGNRIYIDGTRNVEYTFAKIIGYDSATVKARKAVELDSDGKPKVVKQAQYHVMPWGIPHRELTEPYDTTSKIITMEPQGAYDEIEKFTPGKEYILKLGSGVASGDPAVPLGSQVLIPMGSENGVNDQWSIGFKRTYGLILWLLTPESRGGAGLDNVKWLLGYRGGSFMFQYNPTLLTRLGALKFSGNGLFGTNGMFTTLYDPVTGNQLYPYVKYWIVEDPTSIMSQTTSVLNLTTAPRIGVYSSGEDAVVRTLIDAGIPYDNFYDTEVLADILTTPLTDPTRPYTWLHLHHENFLGTSDSQTPIPMISIRDSSNDATGPHSAILYIKGWNWSTYKDGNKYIRIYFGDQMLTPTLTGTYSGCSTGSDAVGPYVNANDSGNFEVSVTIPVKPNGNYFVYSRVGGLESGDESSNYVTYTITDSSIDPTITAFNHDNQTLNVSTGSLIRVSGSNFGASQPGIIVKFDGMGQQVSKTATFPGCNVASSLIVADSTGQFEVTFYTPDVPDGTHEVYAQVDSAISNKVIFNVNNFRTPAISISDFIGIGEQGPKGSTIFVDGTGFVPNYTGINIKFNAISMNVEDTNAFTDDWVFGGTVTSNGDGKFQMKFSVPETTPDGTYEIKAYAGFSSSTEVQLYTVKNATTAEIDVYDLIGDIHSGLCGTELICRGVYFTPQISNISLKFDTCELTLIDTSTYQYDYVFPPDNKYIKSDYTGKFEVKCNVPADYPDGKHYITAFINEQTASNSVLYTIGTVAATPTLLITDSATPYNEGPSNGIINITGSGFSANAEDIQITFANQIMQLSLPSGYTGNATITDNTKIKADETGCFDVQFTVPMLSAMAFTIRASNPTQSTLTYPYTVTPISTFYTSANSNFSTNDDAFNRNAMMYVKVVSTELDKANITASNFTIECAYHTGASKHSISAVALTNNGDYTYSGSFNWGAYANIHNGIWQINFNLRDSSGKIYNPTKIINITGTNVATQSSICSLQSSLSSADFGIYNRSTIYYKIQSNVVEPSFITEKSAKMVCASTWFELGGSHTYTLTELTNNLDGTYNGSYNLDNISPDCHYGMWVLNLKILDSLSQVYNVAKQMYLFSSNSGLRAIVSDNPYFSESYDIRSDGRRSDTASYTPYPVFNSNGTIYIIFNAAPPQASPKINYSSLTSSYVTLDMSEYNTFTTGNYNTNSSVPAEKRGKPKTVTSSSFALANNSNGLFTVEVNLTSGQITSVKRSWDQYFRIKMLVTDTAGVTAQITTGAHQFDNSNSQTIQYASSHNINNEMQTAEINKTIADEYIFKLSNILSIASMKVRNFLELSKKPHYEKKFAEKQNSDTPFSFADPEMHRDFTLLSTPEGRDVYMRFKLNNALKNYGSELQKDDIEREKLIKSSARQKLTSKYGPAPQTVSSPFSLLMPDPAYAATAQQITKYNVAHKIRNWIVDGGYMFTMCYATETLDRRLATDLNGTNIGYEYTLAFKDFDPSKDDPSQTNAIDDYDGTQTVVDQSTTSDKYKRPFAITQNHKFSFPSFSGSTNAFKKKFVKTFTGPNNSPVNILATVDADTVKYLGAEYGKGWFSFLGGHDPRLVETYRLILDNIMVGSLSSNNPPTASSVSYGAIDWDNTDDQYDGDQTDYNASMLYGRAPALFGDITTTYPGDLSNEQTVDSLPYCLEDATNANIAKLYTADSQTPRSEDAQGTSEVRTYKDYKEGSSRYVLVPIVSNYYADGTPAYTQAANVQNSPKYIYNIVGRDRVRIKRFGLFFLSDNIAHANADPLYNEVGALKYGEVRAKFIGYLQ